MADWAWATMWSVVAICIAAYNIYDRKCKHDLQVKALELGKEEHLEFDL